MNNVVRNSTTKRKLDWKQEEELRVVRKRAQRRRTDHKAAREVKYVGGEEE